MHSVVRQRCLWAWFGEHFSRSEKIYGCVPGVLRLVNGFNLAQHVNLGRSRKANNDTQLKRRASASGVSNNPGRPGPAPPAPSASASARHSREMPLAWQFKVVIDASHNSGSITRIPEFFFYNIPIFFYPFKALYLKNSIIGNLWASALSLASFPNVPYRIPWAKMAPDFGEHQRPTAKLVSPRATVSPYRIKCKPRMASRCSKLCSWVYSKASAVALCFPT